MLRDGVCPNAHPPAEVVLCQYDYDHPAHYDGASEYVCMAPGCGRREGRWSGKVLVGDEYEERFGGKP